MSEKAPNPTKNICTVLVVGFADDSNQKIVRFLLLLPPKTVRFIYYTTIIRKAAPNHLTENSWYYENQIAFGLL